jgi:peptidoglycan/LPS O-acetylase OafA/YrhL
MLGRLSFALWIAAAPFLALAQSAGDNGAPTHEGFAWLWIVAAALLLAALLTTFFGRRPRGRAEPPARTP